MYQQGAYYMLILTFKQKPIPVLHIFLTLASIQKSTHFYLIRNPSCFVSKRFCPFFLEIYLSISEYRSQGNTKYQGQRIKIRIVSDKRYTVTKTAVKHFLYLRELINKGPNPGRFKCIELLNFKGGQSILQ